MDSFTRNLVTEWRKLELLNEDGNMLVAVSGGADSCSLALGLAELKKRNKLQNKFIAAHFNHKIRGKESDEDAVFTESFANDLGFEFVLGEQKEAFAEDQNLEQSARYARYNFLSKIAVEHDCSGVLTAHTQNDQAETFLLNLIRGSGIEGLSAMKPIRIFNDYLCFDNSKSPKDLFLIRPILNWAKREDTVEFANKKGITFRDDSMNQNIDFSRVRIRKELLPILSSYNPKIIETLVNTSNVLAYDAEILHSIENDVDITSLQLLLKDLRKQKKTMLFRLLRGWLKNIRGNLKGIDQKHISAIVSLICSEKSGSVCELPNHEKIVKKNGQIMFVADKS